MNQLSGFMEGSYAQERAAFKALLAKGDEAALRHFVVQHPALLADTPESFYGHVAKNLPSRDEDHIIRIFQILERLGHDPELFCDDALHVLLISNQSRACGWLLDHGAVMRTTAQNHWKGWVLADPSSLDIARCWNWTCSFETDRIVWQHGLLAGGGLFGIEGRTLDAVACTMPGSVQPEILLEQATHWLSFYVTELAEGSPVHLSPTAGSAAWLLDRLGPHRMERLFGDIAPEHHAHLGQLRSALDQVALSRHTPGVFTSPARRGL